MGIELDMVFNAYKIKTSEQQEDKRLSCAHDITKIHRREKDKSKKVDSQEFCKRNNLA